MTIKTRLTEKDLIEITFLKFYRNPLIKIATVFFIFATLVLLGVSLAGIYQPEFSNFSFPFVFLVFMPVTIYTSGKKIYRENSQIRETITYHIDNDKLFVEGETFTSTYQWNRIYEVVQTKKWIFIYPGKQNSFAIARKNLWGGEIAGLKEILISNGVKNGLKDIS